MIDPKAELYFNWSPYTYALNTPINAIDPNGKLVIFVNGNHFGDGGQSYWSTQANKLPNSPNASGYALYSFDNAVMDRLGDHHARYVDGGGNLLKGFHPFTTLISPGLSGFGADDRRSAGYEEGIASAGAIIEGLHRSGGVIDESIKSLLIVWVGHGKGYIQAILDYAKQNKIAGVNIAFEADFAPFQPDKQKAVNGVPTMQFSHSQDRFAGDDDMPGANMIDTKSDKQQGHSIFGFIDQIMSLPAGTYKVVMVKLFQEISCYEE